MFGNSQGQNDQESSQPREDFAIRGLPEQIYGCSSAGHSTSCNYTAIVVEPFDDGWPEHEEILFDVLT